MAKTRAKKRTARPMRDADLEAAAREKRRVIALIRAQRDLARLANALTRGDARTRLVLVEVGRQLLEGQGYVIRPAHEDARLVESVRTGIVK